jgi:hypothetical protein
MKPIPALAVFIALLMAPTFLWAQSGKGLWDNVRAGQAKGAKTITQAGKHIKRFKSHLEQWGLDTVYSHGLAIGGSLNSIGWTGRLFYQKRISRTQNHFFQLALSEVKGEKQIKQQRENSAFPQLGNSSPFVFGKLNNVYALQLGHGREFLLLPGVLEGNISISIRAQAGLSLAMLKPYYLKLVYVDYTPSQQVWASEEKYSDVNAEKFLNASYILGASKWGKGLNDITYLPGGYGGLELVIEPLKNKTFIKTVALGTTFALHTGKLEIMADQPAYPWTACVYVGLNIGKRWK